MVGKAGRYRIHVLGIAVIIIAGIANMITEIAAGEARGSAVPLRTANIQKGDWFLYRLNGELIKETALETEKLDDDHLVKYTIEKYDDEGNPVSVVEAAQFLSFERETKDDVNRDKSVRREKKKVTIDGKSVDILAVTYPGDSPYTLWYSDNISITGIVAMVADVPGSEVYWSIQPLGFGGANTRFDVRKYASAK